MITLSFRQITQPGLKTKKICLGVLSFLKQFRIGSIFIIRWLIAVLLRQFIARLADLLRISKVPSFFRVCIILQGVFRWQGASGYRGTFLEEPLGVHYCLQTRKVIEACGDNTAVTLDRCYG
ncbi:hypothetical protein DPMN_072329 [Dreissena polymorpha]|uniref:Uncharacterized protein n=1 Tax=Dreissena polymorpha TaxID=45954 RepID=A0A9D4BWR2_DREPO|nr:hypothetical protein DPMN_072329 [Dreissena polymorpha]